MSFVHKLIPCKWILSPHRKNDGIVCRLFDLGAPPAVALRANAHADQSPASETGTFRV